MFTLSDRDKIIKQLNVLIEQLRDEMKEKDELIESLQNDSGEVKERICINILTTSVI